MSVTATANILSNLSLDANNRLLYPKNKPSASTALILRNLVEEADRTGNSLAVASVLAGQSSEGDDYADVALWLGQGEYDNAKNVLNTLGLQNAQPTKIPLSSRSRLPTTLSVSSAQAAIVSGHLEKLSNPYCFSVPLQSSRTLYVLIGLLEDGWGGLVGVGIHSDD